MIHIEFDLDYTGHKQITEEDYAPSETVEEAILRYAGEAALQQALIKSEVKWENVQAVTRVRDEMIRERLLPIIEQAFTKQLQPTDEFGNPKGNLTTIEERILAMANEYLTKNIGTYNKPETIVGKFIREEVERQVHGALVNAMNEAKNEVTNAVRMKGAEVLADTIKKLAGA